MIRHALISLALTLTACAAPTVAPPEVVPPDPTREVEITQSLNQNLAVTGRRAWVGFARGTGSLTKTQAGELLSAAKAVLKDKGFVVIDARRKAHLDLTLYPFTAGNGRVSGVNLIAYVNEYGKRPREVFEQTARTEARLDEVWPTFATQVLGGFAASELVAPGRDAVMKGDPGCAPRFGFTEDRDRIAAVIADSPAARAGLAVGDIIESFGGTDYATFERDRAGRIYEIGLTAPVRVRRGERIVLTMIRSGLVCAD